MIEQATIEYIGDVEVEVGEETIPADLIIENAQGRWYGITLGLDETSRMDWEYLQDNGEYVPAV